MVVFYLLYLFSGTIKSFLGFYRIAFPVDLTLITAVFLVLAIVYDIFRNGIKFKIPKKIIYTTLLLSLFYVWIILSLLYTPSRDYSYVKTFYFITNLVSFIFPLYIKKFDYRSLFRWFTVILIIFSLLFLSKFQALKDSFHDQESGTIGLYLVLSTLLGISFLVIITSTQKVFKNKIIDYIFATIAFSLILMLGARGPLIFAVLVILLYLFFKMFNFSKMKFKKQTIVVLFISTFVIIATVVLVYFSNKNKIDPFIERSVERFEVMLNKDDSQNGSVSLRIDQFSYSINTIFGDFDSFFIGQGIGSFNLLYEGEDGRGYPHNIFLEVWFELGFIGEALFLAFFAFLFFRKRSNNLITHWIILFIILNMAKSNSLVDIRVYFAFFAIFLLPTDYKTKKEFV